MGRDMSNPNRRVETAEREAARWHARLGESRVNADTVTQFFAWRKDPVNADAYRRVEQAWSQAAHLRGSPGVEAALTSAMTKPPRRRAASPAWGWSGAAVLAALVGVAALAMWFQGRGDAYATAVGEQRVVTLADGSTVRLDTDTRIAVHYASDERGIVLERGQAQFEVAHQSSRPFVVRAGETAVTAVGTVFDVRRTETGVQVVLVSGAVEVDAEAAPAERLAAGQTAVVERGLARIAPVDVRAATSWTDGRLMFRDRPLGEAVREVNRYLEAPVVLGSTDLGRIPVNGVFRIGDRAAFVEAVSAGLNLRTSRGPDGAVVLYP
jgi:transmembrane sensor